MDLPLCVVWVLVEQIFFNELSPVCDKKSIKANFFLLSSSQKNKSKPQKTIKKLSQKSKEI
jgi:hypothetical protein